MVKISKVFISWDQFYQDTLVMYDHIKNLNNIIGIVSVTRGGLVPACIISNLMNIRHIEALALHSYDKDSTIGDTIKVLTYPTQALQVKGKGWLVIDELADSGNSLNHAKTLLPEAFICAVYSKMNNNEILHNSPILFKKEDWICFPWE